VSGSDTATFVFSSAVTQIVRWRRRKQNWQKRLDTNC